MRPAGAWITALSVAVLLIGCGGGGGGADALSQGEAVVSGKVSSATTGQALAGATVRLADGSAETRCDANGDFVLRVPSGRRIRVEFDRDGRDDDPNDDTRGEDDVDEKEDDSPDGVDIDGDEVELDPLEEDEECECDVELDDDGDVVECRVERDDDEERPDERPDRERPRVCEGESRLFPPNEDSPAVGEVELRCDRECCRLEIEVGELRASATYGVALFISPLGAEARLGSITTNDAGRGRLVLEECGEIDLPFAVKRLIGLAGLGIKIVTENGETVLHGRFPKLECGDDDEDEEDDDEEDDEEDEDEDEEDEEGDDEDDESPNDD